MGEYTERIKSWLTTDNLNQAQGKSRDEVFEMFGNKYEPIGQIPNEYTHYLADNITDNKVYCGKGYFIEHAVNHHPEVDAEEYTKIPFILQEYDDVKLDERNPNRNSLIFVKKYDRYGTVAVSVDTTDNNKIVIHKSFFNPKKNPYPHLRSVRVKTPSPDDATSPISQPDKSDPGGRRFSALGDDTTGTKAPADTSLSPNFTDKSSDNFARVRAKKRGKTSGGR